MRKRFLYGLLGIAVVVWGPIIIWFGFGLGDSWVGRVSAIPFILGLGFGGWILLKIVFRTFFGPPPQ